jgi:tetratricopeptide (TPR) repeat protein
MELKKQRLACQERNMKYTSALWNWLTELQRSENNIEYQNRLNQLKNSVNSASEHVEKCSTFEWLERIENDVRQYLNDFAHTKYDNLWTEALRLHKLGDFRGAIKLYDQLIEFNPDFWQAYMNRGIAKYAIMDYDEACSDWKKVISLGKSNEGYAMWIDYCN